VLGGTGLALMQELEELAEECEQVALVPNASTASILEVVEAGGTLEAGIQRARCRGFLEADPSLDLDGTDAAVKLAIVATALWQEPISPKQISRQDIRSLDPQVIRGRAARGSTTRLVARAHRNGPMQVAYEGLPRTSALSTPTDRVVYTYALKNGRSRVHTGCGLGPVETARALLQDLVGLTSLEGVA